MNSISLRNNTGKSGGCRWLLRVVLLCLCCLLLPESAYAQQDEAEQEFTEQQPLVYEDAWDLWPYTFLDENGEPVGYNIDLLKLLMKELNIPYIVKLKPTVRALEDLKAGRADLMFGMDAHFHNEYAQYGKSVIQIFTHSVVHQRGEPVQIKSISDLDHHKVIVHDGSFSHHLMISRGSGANAIPYDDMKEAVQRAHNEPGCLIVWNTLSLKWLIQTLDYDNLELTPVNIQHGEYKFMSNNPRLLEQLDSVFSYLNSTGALRSIQNKWFFPEKQDSGIPEWVWKLAAVLMVVVLGALAYYAVYHRQEKRMTWEVRRSNNRLAQILKTSHVRIWVYNVQSDSITKYDEHGREEAFDIAPETFFYDLKPADAQQVRDSLRQIANQTQKSITLNLKSSDRDGADHYLTLVLSVLRRDKTGIPTDIIGTYSDITAERHRQQQVKNNMLRYQSIFNSAMVDTVSYDADGYITDMNEKAASVFPGGKEGALRNRVSLFDVVGENVDLSQLGPLWLTRIFLANKDQRVFNPDLHDKRMYYELQLIPVRDQAGHLLSVYGTGRDVSDMVNSFMRLQRNVARLEHTNSELNDYIRNINYVLENGGVRMIGYSPKTHTLIIYSEIGRVQYRLTQTRGLALTDESSKRTARRLLNSMDNGTRSALTASIKTVIRLKGGRRLSLYLSFVPTFDANGLVDEYFGMFRDISEIKATEEELARETVKAQEVETVKNAFLRNMSYEIRIPLNSVVGFAELFDMEHSPEDEELFCREIKENSSRLLDLINDILFLSRLDARMIEFKNEPVDFVPFFTSRCQLALAGNQREGVAHIVESPYQRLVVDTDSHNIGIVIDQMVANAAAHTETGLIRLSCDYVGESLVLTFHDTGSGISPERLSQIFDRFVTTGDRGTGLGLSICQEIVRQMGGKITIKSEVGKGTIVWVTIPCHCSEIVRK